MILSLLLKTRTRVININGQYITPMQPRPAKNFSKLLPHTSAQPGRDEKQIAHKWARYEIQKRGGEIKKLFILRIAFYGCYEKY